MNYPSGIIWRHSWLICLILNVCRSRSVWNSMLPVDHPIRTQLCSPFPITHNSPLFPDIPSHTQRHAYQRHYQRSNRRKNVKKETAYHLKQSSTEKKKCFYHVYISWNYIHDWMQPWIKRLKKKKRKKRKRGKREKCETTKFKINK